MRRLMMIAGIAALGLAGAAMARQTPPATPMQGSPPNTNTPAPAASDAAPMSGMDMPATNGAMTAPATKPMAGANNTPTDSASADPDTKAKKRAKKSSSAM